VLCYVQLLDIFSLMYSIRLYNGAIWKVVCMWWYMFFCVLCSVTSELKQVFMTLVLIAVQKYSHWNGLYKEQFYLILYIFLHVVIAETIIFIHVPEWISNLLSFFSFVFTDGFLKKSSCNTWDFLSSIDNPQTLQILFSACILTATKLTDFRMSLILENKKETLKTTRKSSLFFVPREQCFHRWRLASASPPRTISYTAIGDPYLELLWTDSHLKYENLPRYRWPPITFPIDDKIFLSRPFFFSCPYME